jgi:hypothetical protein
LQDKKVTVETEIKETISDEAQQKVKDLRAELQKLEEDKH